MALGAFARPYSSEGWQRQARGIERFTAGRFSEVWADAEARKRLTFELAANLDADVTVLDRDGSVLELAGARCADPDFTAEPLRGDEPLGQVLVCADLPGTHRHVALALLIGALILWAAAGAISFWLVRPLGEVARVAREIGDGNLGSRVDTRHQARKDEIADLVVAINDMAERIEKQIEDQRALLAAVSHEIRTPLGHLRVIAELVREGETGKIRELEREISDIDTLVDQLLASSRLDFETIDRRPLDATDLCLRAMERADVDAGLLSVDSEDIGLEGDAMLLARALGNLLENAERHAEKVVGVRIEETAEGIRFSVEDRGPGFAREDRERAFESFYRGSARQSGAASPRGRGERGSLGIGLALVDRIARAHGGSAWIEDAPSGARVGFDVARSTRG